MLPKIPGVFTADNLKRYSAVVFSNTNNFDFDTDAQREAFQKYIEPAVVLSACTPPPPASASSRSSFP